MNKPVCTVYEPSSRYSKKVVRGLKINNEVEFGYRYSLIVEIQGEGFSYARVIFKEVLGFRVLDEVDLCEFWNDYAEPNGWLYEVHSGGWMELENYRNRFISLEIFNGWKEYLLVDNQCISVICAQKPIIEELGGNFLNEKN